MDYPNIKVIGGADQENIIEKLRNAKVYYSIIKRDSTLLKSKFFLELSCPTETETVDGVEIEAIEDGLTLPFFNWTNVPLRWNPMDYVPSDWSDKGWEPNVNSDVDYWFSKESAVTLDEKTIMKTIISHGFNWDAYIHKLYNGSIMSTFRHPEIQKMLDKCCDRKIKHMHVWNNIRCYYMLSSGSFEPRIIKRYPAVSLIKAVADLTELIEAENICNSAATKCLTYFTEKGHALTFMKLVQRRDKESKENANMLKILLKQVEKMYPCLIKTSNYFTKVGKHYAKQHNDGFCKMPNLEMFDSDLC